MEDYSLVKAPEDSIEAHRRFYLGLLGSERSVRLSSLIPSYRVMRPLSHQKIEQREIDAAVLNYSLSRLPSCVHRTKRIFLIQNKQDLVDQGVNIQSWRQVTARARRRFSFWDRSSGTLVVFIASPSDIDDLVNLLVAYKVEREKIKSLLVGKEKQFEKKGDFSLLGVTGEEQERLKDSLGKKWQKRLMTFLREEFDPELKLFAPHWIGYRQIAQDWWHQVSSKLIVNGLENLPVYFVSSNLHALVNIVSGFIRKNQLDIFGYVDNQYPDLYQEWLRIKSGENPLRLNDFLYYISKLYFHDKPEKLAEKIDFEENLGIRGEQISGPLSCGIQLIPVSAIVRSSFLDPNLIIRNQQQLLQSRALIININYPLGFAAYFLLSEVMENLKNIRGVYLVGKAAVLSGKVGDIQLPKVVFDERTSNIFFLENIFNQHFPCKTFSGSVLREQKSISVYSPLLENQKQLERYVAAGFNIIEMESGPYLLALSEMGTARQFSQNAVLSLENLPFDFGIINYASDNPLSRAFLGTSSLGTRGVASTYLALLAVVQRIIEREESLNI